MSQSLSDCIFESNEADAASLASRGQPPPIAVDQRESLAAALVATVREPFAVLSRDLRIVAANRPFRAIFQARFTNESDLAFGDSSIAQWDLPTLEILRGVFAQSVIEGRQIDLDVPDVGRRRMRLNARGTRGEADGEALLLVGLDDVTATREIEDLQASWEQEQEVLLKEIHHRVANSLQIIASLLLLKARAVQSTETRQHLHDVHNRLISLATVQRQLSVSRPGSDIELGPYLKVLCEGLAKSMISDDQTVTIAATAASGPIKSEEAVRIGLIVTELVINSLKHGFPNGSSGHVAIDFVREKANWRLSVSDDGVGRPTDPAIRVQPGLGTSIIEALARSLGARVEIGLPNRGATTTIIHSI